MFHTCLGGGTGFLILRKSAPEADRLCRCDLEEWLWPPGTPFPDSSDNESRLSVDWPLTIRLGPMRFSGEDSSAKLCRGGEVSELPPDFGPTVNKPIGLFPICYSKNSFNFVLFLHYTINQHTYTATTKGRFENKLRKHKKANEFNRNSNTLPYFLNSIRGNYVSIFEK